MNVEHVRRAIVIEDEVLTRSLLASALTSWGYAVAIAESAEDAWRVAERFHPEVAVVDLELPGGPSGLDALTVLRRRYPPLPAVVLTNHRSPQLVQNAPPAMENCLYLIKADVQSPDTLREALLQVQGVVATANYCTPVRADEAQDLPRITKAQAEILRLMAQGLSNEQIAQVRFTTKRAVELSVQKIYRELGLSNEGANARVMAVTMYRQSRVTVR